MAYTDILTQQHAQIIGHAYNLAPDNSGKCERAIEDETEICSLFFATKNRDNRCLIQYSQDDLEFPE